MLSVTTREADFYGSIKKHFLGIESVSGIKTFFGELAEIPVDSLGVKCTSWVVLVMGRRDIGPVSEQQIGIDIYTRNDSEGDNLSILYDTVMEYIVDEDAPHGLTIIPFYDTSTVPWVVVGGIMPFLQPALGRMQGDDFTQFRSINILCKWGGK